IFAVDSLSHKRMYHNAIV
ncbi:hypothetical protein ECEC1849_5724, partial [Escherichia coli EC1849]